MESIKSDSQIKNRFKIEQINIIKNNTNNNKISIIKNNNKLAHSDSLEHNNNHNLKLNDIYVINSINSNTNNNKNQNIKNNKINTPNNPNNARKRWKILARAIIKSDSSSSVEDDEIEASVRRFNSFNLIQHENLPKNYHEQLIGFPKNWFTYRIKDDQKEYSINIHQISHQPTAEDLIGFNNTGNICVWPSEEALTYLILDDLHLFKNGWILELGGGMTCLAGLIVAKYGNPYVVHLTDGNATSVENVKKTVRLNEFNCYTRCSVLKWENLTKRHTSEFERFDFILSADCLFFDEARISLVNAIWHFLSPNGTALVVAPKRGRTLQSFVKQSIDKGFNCRIFHRYNERIWQKHLEMKKSNLYDEDIHYPILIKLTKQQNFNN